MISLISTWNNEVYSRIVNFKFYTRIKIQVVRVMRAKKEVEFIVDTNILHICNNNLHVAFIKKT